MRKFVTESLTKEWWAGRVADCPVVGAIPPYKAGQAYNPDEDDYGIYGYLGEQPLKKDSFPGEDLQDKKDLSPEEDYLRRAYKFVKYVTSDEFWADFQKSPDEAWDLIYEKTGEMEPYVLNLVWMRNEGLEAKENAPDINYDYVWWRFSELLPFTDSDINYLRRNNKLSKRFIRRLGCKEEEVILWFNLLKYNQSYIAEYNYSSTNGPLNYRRSKVLSLLMKALLEVLNNDLVEKLKTNKSNRLRDLSSWLPIIQDRFMKDPKEVLVPLLEQELEKWEKQAIYWKMRPI